MALNRVVVTGFGTINPIGNTADEFWAAATSGQSGVQRITQFDTTDFTTQIGGIIQNFDPENFFYKKEARRTSRFILLALMAANEAVAHSGLNIEAEADSIGVEIGSGIGGIEILEETARVLMQK